MLGAFFNSRGPVIGIPLALILGQQFLLGLILKFAPILVDYLPYIMVMPPQTERGSSIVGQVLIGSSPDSWSPVISALPSILIFVLLGIWRFRNEEL